MDKKIRDEIVNYSKLNNSYGAIARYIIKNHNASDISIRKICDECYISPPSVTRFAKKLGFSGFYEFKYMLLASNNVAQEVKNTEFKNSSIAEICTTQQQNLITTIDKIVSKADEVNLEEVVNLINDCEKVVIFAVGGTAICAEDFQKKLRRANVAVEFTNDHHEQYYLAKNSNLGTIAIGISYSGNTYDVLNSLDLAKQNGSKTILISNDKVSKDYIDINLCVHSVEPITRDVTTTGRLAILFLLDILFLHLLQVEKSRKQILKSTNYTLD